MSITIIFTIIILALIITFGAYILNLYSKRSAAVRDITALETLNSAMEQRTEELNSALNLREKQILDLTSQNADLKVLLARSETEKSASERSLEQFKEQMLKNELRMKESFENIAVKIIEERSQKLNNEGTEQLKRSIAPLEKELDSFKKRIDEIYNSETRERASLGNELKMLMDLNRRLSTEANTLARAIKGEHNPKLQGDWGEMILETILTNSGLKKDEHYFTQQSNSDDEGTRKRPDVIVRYPDSREVIIDSKVSLTAYVRYIEASTDVERESALSDHIRSVKSHIDSLSSKQYDMRENSLDFVMMFMPVEPAYMLALSSDNTLWDYAYKRKILLISPTHLITALKLVYDLWVRDAQNKNVIAIAERGALMYDKFVGFISDMQLIGKSIDATHKSYDNAFSKLTTGRGNLIRQAEMLKELGISSAKDIPVSSSEYIETNLNN